MASSRAFVFAGTLNQRYADLTAISQDNGFRCFRIPRPIGPLNGGTTLYGTNNPLAVKLYSSA